MRYRSLSVLVTSMLLIGACSDGVVVPENPVDTISSGIGEESVESSTVLTVEPPVQLTARVGEAMSGNAISNSSLPEGVLFSVFPELPVGLSLDPLSAVISGTPSIVNSNQEFIISNNGTSFNTFNLAVGPDLPEAFLELDSSYSAEILVEDAAIPVRMAVSNDGRLFYGELNNGVVRIVHPTQGLLADPFASFDIVTGTEQGLIGLALDPDFGINGHAYVHITVADQGSGADQAQIVRITDVQNIGVNPTVIIDELPIDVHNGGELVFDQMGNLYLGRGDIGLPELAQLTGSTAGRVLRYTSVGGIPTDNPFPGDPEWVRGLRNTFAMTIHPQTGALFGADAGAVANDRINILESGKNFGWGLPETETIASTNVGLTIQTWPEAVTPTALFFHTGTNQPEFENNLFYSSFNNESINRLVLSGAGFTEFENDLPFAAFSTDSGTNKPLHILETANGGLYISTLDTIYHVYPTILQ